MSKKLILYGASNPTTLKVIQAINQASPTWELIGFVDDERAKHKEAFGYPILGGGEDLPNLGLSDLTVFNNVFSSTTIRRRVSGKLLDFQTTNLITPGTDLNLVTCGQGIVIEQLVAIDAYSVIGDHCALKRSCSIGHETKLGSFVFVGPGATICGRVEIGSGSYIGAGSCIRDGTKIGKNCIVGAGAVVVKDVPPNVTVVGNPARVT